MVTGWGWTLDAGISPSGQTKRRTVAHSLDAGKFPIALCVDCMWAMNPQIHFGGYDPKIGIREFQNMLLPVRLLLFPEGSYLLSSADDVEIPG